MDPLQRPRYELTLNLNRFGSYASTHGNDRVGFAARWTLDAQFSYHLNQNITLSLGGTNVFDAIPSK